MSRRLWQNSASARRRPVQLPQGMNWLTVQGGGLRDGSGVFRFSGANAYWLALNDNTRDVNNDPTYPTSQQVDAAFSEIAAMGGLVARVHTLGISVGKPKTMMPALGSWDAVAVDKADSVIASAKTHSLRLMVPLVDRWDFYHGGGLSFCRMRGLTESMGTFYTDATIRTDFKAYISTLLNHINPYTGLAWKDDPTLAIWETGNEVWDAPEAWHNDITAHIKSLAPNALIADGTAASGRHILATTGFNGTDAPGLDDPNTDILGTHFYDTQRRDITWLATDAAAATAAGKAYIIGEYDWIDGDNNGVTKTGGATRAAWLQAIRDDGNVAGDLMWTLCINGIGTHRDGYELYRPTPENSEQSAGWTDFSAHAPLMAASALTPGASDEYVQRSGTQLTLGGSLYVLTAYNMYEALSDGTGTRGCGADLYSGSTLATAFDNLGVPQQMGGGAAIRCWWFQRYSVDGSTRDWSRFDHLLTEAKAAGYRVVPVLTNMWATCEISPSYHAEGTDWTTGGDNYKRTPAWFETGYSSRVDAGLITSYRAWVQEVVARYKDEPAIAFWQIMNEAECGDYSDSAGYAATLKAFADDIAGVIKGIDSNHLVSLGTMGSGQPGTDGDNYSTIHSGANIDIADYHDYSTNSTTLPGDEWNGLGVRITQMGTLNKPLIIGEYGNQVGTAGAETVEARSSLWDSKLTTYFSNGIAAAFVWNYSPTNTSAGFDVGPGDPAIEMIRSHGGGAGIASYDDTFDGDGVLDAAKWSAVGISAGASATRVTGRMLLQTGTIGGYGDYVQVPSAAPATADRTIAFTFWPDGKGQSFESYFHGRLRASTDGTDQYYVQFQSWDGAWGVFKKVGGVETALSGGWTVISDWAANVPIHVEFSTTGTGLTLRVWTGDRVTARPSSPTWSSTDSSIASGRAELVLFGGSPARQINYYVDDWVVT